MNIYTRNTTGLPNVDTEINRLYTIISRLGISPSQASSSTNNNGGVTEEGGQWVRVYNGSGMELKKGVMCKFNGLLNNSVTICPLDELFADGIVYDTIPVNSYGKLVYRGYVDVLFNASGATANNWFRISKSTDTNGEIGKAQTMPLTSIDNIRYAGKILASVTGEGIARCFKK